MKKEIIQNNNSNLYLCSPVYSSDKAVVERVIMNPIIAYAFTIDDGVLRMRPIISGWKHGDDGTVFYDRSTDQWSDKDHCGVGLESMTEYFQTALNKIDDD
ncbi:MAG: hypothetical protein KJ725_14415 [Gammaproteobacteria bacterium]|nr:hypothetical protein [Gammaproteobacteria bacterium]